MGCSPPGSSIHGIFQARVLEWGAIAFSKTQHCQLNKCFLNFKKSMKAGPGHVQYNIIYTIFENEKKKKNYISKHKNFKMA